MNNSKEYQNMNNNSKALLEVRDGK